MASARLIQRQWDSTGPPSRAVGDQTASAFLRHGFEIVEPARGTIRLVLHVGVLAEEVTLGRRRRRRLLVLDAPLEFRSIDILSVHGARLSSRLFNGALDAGNGDRREDADDGHDDHDFDEGKSRLEHGLHASLSLVGLNWRRRPSRDPQLVCTPAADETARRGKSFGRVPRLADSGYPVRGSARPATAEPLNCRHECAGWSGKEGLD